MTTAPSTRTADLEALLGQVADEFTQRLNRGEQPDIEEYATRYPDLAAMLRQVLPTLLLMRVPSGERSLTDRLDGCLGDFRLVREVGRGGMGIVYEAEQISLQRRVAMKVLPFAATMDPKHLQRFQNEARAAAHLHHPNIVPVYFVGCERGVHFYAIQFIEGYTLAQLIQALQPGDSSPKADATGEHQPGVLAATAAVAALSTERLGPRTRGFYRRAAELIVQAAEALEHAHSLGIVHRDVKPANLIVDQVGNLWVGDFGLARFGADAGLTVSGDLLGTLRYMAPEQALARHGLVDHRADVYGLGACLYELLTLRPVVTGTERAEVLRQIAFEEPTAPRQLNRAIPVELETIILKCLAKNPAERYAAAGETAKDLRRFLEDKPIQAKRPTLRHRATKWARRHKAAVWSAAFIALIQAASLGWIIGDRQARRAEAERRVVEALEVAEPKLRQGNPHDSGLITAARQAEAQPNIGVVREELRRQVEYLLADLEMLAKLEHICLGRAAVKEGHFDNAAADPAYAEAFRKYGIDVDTLGVQEAAARIRPRAIGFHLAAALDQWAMDRFANKGANWKRLLFIAREVDPDPWRCALRDARITEKKEDLSKLAASVPIKDLPPTSLLVVVDFLRGLDRREPAAIVLREGQQPCPSEIWINQLRVKILREGLKLYRSDFWINHELAQVLAHDSGHLDEAIGYYYTALALRPESPGVHFNLGVALSRKGRFDEAIGCLQEAIRLKEDYAEAHAELGSAFCEQGRVDEGISSYEKSIQLKDDDAVTHTNFGIALRKTGRINEAIAEFKKVQTFTGSSSKLACGGSRLRRG